MYYTLSWIKSQVDQGNSPDFIFFWGHSNPANKPAGKFVFSQWYPSTFVVDGKTYQTAEHWMMAGKARLFENYDLLEKILKAEKPGAAKDLGRQIQGFDETQWSAAKFEIVKTGNFHKFSQHRVLKEYLLSTGNKILVEASPNDFVWGIGLAENSKGIENPHNWGGENLLGFALMEVRDLLRNSN